MAEREKLVYIVLDEANRPTSLGAFEDGDTIASGTLPNNVRTAVEDVDTLNTRVDNLDTSVGDLSTAIDNIEAGSVDPSVLAAAQFVTDSSGDIITTSNSVTTLSGDVTSLSGRVGDVETSAGDLSSYINANESSWAAGIDAGTLADITTVSTVVSNTSGANGDIVTSYGAYSGEAVGIQYAYGTFDGSGSIATNIDFNNNDVANILNLTAINLTSSGITVNGDITVTGLVDGVDISTRDAFLSSLTTSSEALSGAIDTLDGRVTTAEGNITDLTTSSGEISGVVDTLTTAVTNISNNVTNLTTSSAQLSGAIDTLDGTLTNVQGSTVALSSYIESNEATWNAGSTGIDPDLLADITTVSTIVSNTSGANEDIVTSYSAYSGAAVGIQYANDTFTGAGSVKTNLDLNDNDITDVGNITVTGLVDGVDISTRDTYLSSLATSSEELSSVISTNTANIATNTANVTALGVASGGWTSTQNTVTTNQSNWTTGYNLATDLTSLSGEGFLNGSNPTLNTTLTGTGNIKIDGGVSAGPLSAAGSILSTGIIKSSTSLQSLGNIAAANNITTTTGDIVATTGDVSANGVSVTALGGRVTTAETNITNLTTSSEGLSGAIDTLDAYVTDLATSSEEVSAVVAINTANIATNTGNISTNTTNITNLTTSSEELSAVITSNTGNIENLVNAFYIADGVYYTSGFRVGSSGIPFDVDATTISDNQYYAYNLTKDKFHLIDTPIVVDALGVATFAATENINEGSFDLPITVNQAMTFSGGATLQFSGSGGSVDFGDASNISFGSQQTFTPSSNTFATRNILIGNELSSGPECVVNLEGSTIWANGSVLSAGSGCDITLRGDKFFYGPTNIYGPLGTDLDLDGNNLIDVNNITTANAPLTLQVTGAVNPGNLNIKNTATGIGAGAVNVEAVGNVSVSAGDTVDITAPTVNLDGTGLFGLSGGAVQIEATSTYVTIDSGAYLNITAATNLNLNSADNGTQSVNIDGCPFPNPFIQIKADTGLNINSAANVAVTFSGVDVSGGGKVANHYSYNFGTTPTSVQVDTAGIYEVSFNIMVYDPASTAAQRSTHIAQITKNGTVVGPGAIGYVRSNSGSNEASYNMNGYIINLASGDDIGVNFERVATATSTTSILPGYDHILTIKRIG